MNDYWPIALGIGVGTFLIRISFIVLIDRVRLPVSVNAMLRFIPAAVLSALIAPAIFMHGGTFIGPENFERPAAGVLAFLVAWKTRNVLATIGSGMGALWLLQWLS